MTNSVHQNQEEISSSTSGANAIEVIAQFDDAVLQVTYLTNPNLSKRGRKNSEFTIGTRKDVNFVVGGSALADEKFSLVRNCGGHFVLYFTDQMHGDIEVDGRRTALSQLCANGIARPADNNLRIYVWNIPQNGRARIELGNTRFLVAATDKPRKSNVPIKIHWRTQAYTAAVGALMLVLLLLAYSIPPDAKSLAIDALLKDYRLANFLIKAEEHREDFNNPIWLHVNKGNGTVGSGRPAAGAAGTMGTPSSQKIHRHYELKGPSNNPDVHVARTLAYDAAQKAGVLGLMRAMEGSHIAAIFGHDTALGSDAENIMGGLIGTEAGDARGTNGLGIFGSDRGGNGHDASIGVGRLRMIGRDGTPFGTGYGPGHSNDLGQHRARAPEVTFAPPGIRGSLDKELIRRSIRPHLNEVRFCYEKELLKNPGLDGRIVVQFTIAGTGQVVSAGVQNSSMNNANVEECIAEAVKRWEFPRPSDGGVVIVSYPFLLKSAGE